MLSVCLLLLKGNSKIVATTFNDKSKNMSSRTKVIIDDIKSYIQKNGGDYNAWYIGISEDVQDIVLNILKINSHFWMYKEAESPQIAREVVNYFLTTLGTDESMGGGDSSGCIVYVCKKLVHTNP